MQHSLIKVQFINVNMYPNYADMQYNLKRIFT